MDAPDQSEIFLFGHYHFDRRSGRLSRRGGDGVLIPASVGSRALDVLHVLIDRPGELVSKDAIMSAVWPATVVSEANLTVQISALRRALDQGVSGASHIQTVPGRGYRLISPVRRLPSAGVGQLLHPTVRQQEMPRLSLMVAPLRILGMTKAHKHLVAGVTEDIAADMSHLPETCVISYTQDQVPRRHSSNPRALAREGCASYMIQGIIRVSTDGIGVNAQLIETATGSHVWAERFNVPLDGTADVRNEITGRLVRVFNIKLTEDVNRLIEMVPRNEWTPYDLVTHARAVGLRPYSVTNRHEALACFEKALAKDFGSISARLGIARVLITNVAEGWSQSVDQDLTRAEYFLQDVLRDDADNPECHNIMGLLRRLQGRFTESLVELETAIGLLPNYVPANMQLGCTLTALGRPEVAVPQLERTLRLAPHDCTTPVTDAKLGQCKLFLGYFEEAIFWLRKAIAGNPRLYPAFRDLAAAHGLRGERAEATAAFRQAVELQPQLLLPSGLVPFGACPQFIEFFENTIYAGLRRAGLLNGWGGDQNTSRPESAPRKFVATLKHEKDDILVNEILTPKDRPNRTHIPKCHAAAPQSFPDKVRACSRSKKAGK